MAMMREYAAMAAAAYEPDPELALHTIDPKVKGWWMFDFRKAQPGLAEAFQGAAFRKAHEIVYAFKGTDFSRGQTTKRDFVADLSLALGINTIQYDRAMSFIKRSAKPARWRVSLCGHSLGGAIAQVVGNRMNVPFVTFNAPGVAIVARTASERPTVLGLYVRALGAAIGTVLHPMQTAQDVVAYFNRPVGVNFRLGKDLVGYYGSHIGRVIELPFTGSRIDELTLKAHGIKEISQALGLYGQSAIEDFTS